MKLFLAKCPERATLRKLWRQTGNSSLLPAKCWPLLHVIRACSWRWPDFVAGIPARFSKFAFVLFCYITNHLMTGPLGNSEFCFPRISMFPSTSSRETLRFSGNKIHCSPRDQSLSVYYITSLTNNFLHKLVHHSCFLFFSPPSLTYNEINKHQATDNWQNKTKETSKKFDLEEGLGPVSRKSRNLWVAFRVI